MAPEIRPAASRRERPAKPALTREGIVAAAVGIMQAEGLDRVTMRRLAQELDTGPASLYVYLRNTAELHAAMLEELSLEDRINDEVRVILEAYSEEMRRTGANYQEMFRKVKSELTRKYKAVL